MFLDELDREDQLVFLSLARSMIAADGVVTSEEQQMLDDAVEEMGLEEGAPIEQRTVEDACAAITSPSAQAFTLLELVSFALVDGDYAEHEKALFRQVSEFWGVDPMTAVRIEKWGEDRIRMSAETAEIIQEILDPLPGGNMGD